MYRVHAWAEKLGTELWTSGDFITRRKQVQEVVALNCNKIVVKFIGSFFFFFAEL